MPDPTRQTISASEAAALWNASPYITKWMLYQKFANGADISSGDDDRKSWGTRMQPLIIKQVAEEKKLEVIPNVDDSYVRRGNVGCTRDAVIMCPDRGPGALEIKCVFDYKVWATQWNNGEHVPRHNEIQLQTQMFVGDDNGRYAWGIIAVWVCADLYYFERRPIPEFIGEIEKESADFFGAVHRKEEPDVAGIADELPLIRRLFPGIVAAKELDFSNDPDHVKTSELVSMYQYHKELVAGNEPLAEAVRIKLLALAQDAELVKLPCGVFYRIKKSGKGKTILPFVPDKPSPPPPPRGDSVLAAG